MPKYVYYPFAMLFQVPSPAIVSRLPAFPANFPPLPPGCDSIYIHRQIASNHTELHGLFGVSRPASLR